MQLVTYLGFDGNCREAFEFYAEALGGEIEAMMTYGDAPPEARGDPSMSARIMHACLMVGDAMLMGGDAPPGHADKRQGFSASIHVESPKEAERIFAALSKGGEIQMPLMETFWSQRFAMFIDRFGTPWMVNCSTPAA